jgi:hypothetical protein
MEKSIDELDLFHFGQSEVYSQQRIFFKSIESSVNSNFLNTNDPHNNKISKADTQWHFLPTDKVVIQNKPSLMCSHYSSELLKKKKT